VRVLVIVLAVGLVLGHPGPARAQLNCDAGIDFYPGGAIRSCTLSGHHRLHTAGGLVVTCASGHRTVLYEDGRLQSCVLARPLTSGPAPCAAGHLLELGPDGAPTACGAMPAPGR
jgi:hypothetical protein